MTPRRLSLLISLALHLLVGLLASLYIVQVAAIDDEAIIAELLDPKAAPKLKRRMSPRVVKQVKQPQFSEILPPRLQQSVTTAARIPTGDSRFTLPASELSMPGESDSSADGAGMNAESLERRLLRAQRRAEIPSVIPQIRPQRLTGSSIFDKLESTNLPQPELDPGLLESPSVNLSDVTQRPRFLHQVSPKYPDLARRAQKEGVVWLEALIGVDGMAEEITVIKSIGFGCDEAAVEALKASRFAPARQDKQAVVVRIQIPYRFQLED